MKTHTYTATEVEQLTALASEAQAIEQEWNTLLTQVDTFIRNYTKDCYLVWNINYPELLGIAEIIQLPIDVPNYNKLPKVGQIAYKNIQRPTEWQKANNRVRKAITKLEKELKKFI